MREIEKFITEQVYDKRVKIYRNYFLYGLLPNVEYE